MSTAIRLLAPFRRTAAALATVAALGGLVAGLPAPAADAGPSKMITFIYYDDASHSQVVGIKLISCWHGTSTSGQVTPYYEREEEACVF